MRARGYTLLTLLLLSCATTKVLPPVSLDFFVPAPPTDPWNQKVEEWQGRHGHDSAVGMAGETAVADPNTPSELAREYDEFTRTLRRRVAEDTVRWVQDRSRQYYEPDGERDHWATLGEVIRTGSDDCDGLDLLTFVLLRRLGFAGEEIYRAIVVERESGQHHMVTLWFDEGKRKDPFVLDPTGVVTKEMVRLSEIKGWEPIQLFDEAAHYRVEPAAPLADAVAER